MSSIRLTGLTDRLGDPALHRLLVDAFGSGEAASKVIERYQSGEWSLFGYLQGVVIACIGLERLSASRARIRGIAVAHGRRGRGIGRSLITDAQRKAGATLVAETDEHGVDFYRGCGFDVESIGEQYAGVERFRCTLNREPEWSIEGERRRLGFIGAGASMPVRDVRASKAPDSRAHGVTNGAPRIGIRPGPSRAGAR